MTLPTDPLQRHAVFAALSGSRASLERAAALGDGLGVALWRNRNDSTGYARPGHHTMSVYLQGGHATYRRDQPANRGAPGRLCLLPADHESRWHVGGPQRFLHLYFRPETLAWHCVRLLDREPRSVVLRDLTFADDPCLHALSQRLAALDWLLPEARMAGNALAHEAVSHLVLTHAGRAAPTDGRGGLSARARRAVRDWIEGHPESNPTLGELAALVGLSEFHFARMFRVSFGMPPHAWVLQTRLERAQRLLADPRRPLREVAARAGFASASHLNRRFQAAFGVTPGAWRAGV
ncbi:helix-turn-helix domain-containing protein [Cupriavidus taiwanensis]|uniref:helix-turn-helix domain-containing protein n=1 Tax=Cupriavidus taiwanensis TaxID=164546 RepID=UPI000E10A200|nr:AraC family transcriptional regulator [Cupriavidus taiwanensis]SOY59597.1 putative transcription regulator, AraC family [Cupriavidus taiwanensis]SOY59991.1 putative transcription regulator, AraC family [Cupriavidus taiwanensis]SOY92087.1 putative transcription regulator, AraC family [Cupriavidus taiwanensis]SOZ65895.1 putative transcription regulator, AraC family [Cupriavidus taiwanensis]SOZ83578.1 putative transcription regulator, AraC family [Cupriavidus taiwanensis]